MRKIIIILLAFNYYTYPQNLVKKRVDKLNETVVQVIVESGKSKGTGFFVSKSVNTEIRTLCFFN